MKTAVIVLVVVICAIPVFAQDVTAPIPQNQTAKSAVPADLPDEYGVYVQTAQGWQRLKLAQPAKHEQKQSGFTQWTGMTMSGNSFHIKVIYPGPHAALQLPAGRPKFYVRGSDASKAENLVLYRFKEKKDRRDLETIQTSAEQTGGGEQRNKAVSMQMIVKRLDNEVFVLTTEDDVTAGEYLMTPDGGNSGYDFSVQ